MADEERRTSAEMTDDELFDDDPGIGEDEARPREIDIEPTPDPAMEPAPEPEPAPKPEDDAAKRKADEPESDAKKKGDEKDDDTEYGHRVQKRIAKEVYKTKTAETRAANAERENTELRHRLGMTEGRALDSTISDLEGRASGLRDQLRVAKENGDTDKELEITDKLIDVRADLKEAQRIKGRMRPETDNDGGRRAPEPDRGERLTPEHQQERAIRGLPKRAQTWVRERGFFGWTESQRAFAMGIDAEMTKEGFDPGTPEYYTEMDARIGRVFPDLYEDEDDDGPKPEPAPKPTKRTDATPPVAAPSAAPANPSKGGKVTLGPADFKNMRNFGLDPENAEHCKEYARNKRRAEQAEAAAL